jgi:hypothetical protein
MIFKASGFNLRWSTIHRHMRANIIATSTPTK